MLRSIIGKNVHSRLNIRKCVATLKGAFFGMLLNGTRVFLELLLLYEKKKLLIHRSIWLMLLILGILIPIIISNAPEKEVEIIDDNGYINEYYESLNETNCEIEVVFNCEVDSGYIMVAFMIVAANCFQKKVVIFMVTIIRFRQHFSLMVRLTVTRY